MSNQGNALTPQQQQQQIMYAQNGYLQQQQQQQQPAQTRYMSAAQGQQPVTQRGQVRGNREAEIEMDYLRRELFQMNSYSVQCAQPYPALDSSELNAAIFFNAHAVTNLLNHRSMNQNTRLQLLQREKNDSMICSLNDGTGDMETQLLLGKVPSTLVNNAVVPTMSAHDASVAGPALTSALFRLPLVSSAAVEQRLASLAQKHNVAPDRKNIAAIREIALEYALDMAREMIDARDKRKSIAKWGVMSNRLALKSKPRSAVDAFNKRHKAVLDHFDDIDKQKELDSNYRAQSQSQAMNADGTPAVLPPPVIINLTPIPPPLVSTYTKSNLIDVDVNDVKVLLPHALPPEVQVEVADVFNSIKRSKTLKHSSAVQKFKVNTIKRRDMKSK